MTVWPSSRTFCACTLSWKASSSTTITTCGTCAAFIGEAFIGVETASSVGASDANDPTRDGGGLFGDREKPSIDGTGASSGSFFGVNGATAVTGVSLRPVIVAPVSAAPVVGQKPAVGSAARRASSSERTSSAARPAASSAFTIRTSRGAPTTSAWPRSW